jgi:hypothetical protein
MFEVPVKHWIDGEISNITRDKNRRRIVRVIYYTVGTNFQFLMEIFSKRADEFTARRTKSTFERRKENCIFPKKKRSSAAKNTNEKKNKLIYRLTSASSNEYYQGQMRAAKKTRPMTSLSLRRGARLTVRLRTALAY